MSMSAGQLRKNGGISGEFSGSEGVDARQMGSPLATEHKPHISDTNSTEQDTVSGKVDKSSLGCRGVQD